MVESRCGLLCSECSYREPNNCPGCINTHTVFWGECRVKKCCESKRATHCGECIEMPCSALNEFSYDEEHGDNGKRIEQCKKWRVNMEIKYISSVLLVKDLKASRKFYEDFLNLKVQDDHGENIGYTTGLSLWKMEHALENIFQSSAKDQILETGGHKLEIYFETDDIDKAFESAIKNEIEIMHGITLQPWGQKVFRMYDPDKNIVEIGESMSIVNERIKTE